MRENMRERLAQAAQVTLGSLGIAAVLSWVGPVVLDGARSGELWADHSAEAAQADALQDAIHAAERRARFEAAARALCMDVYGPQTNWRETVDGQVNCVTRRGRVIAMRSQQ